MANMAVETYVSKRKVARQRSRAWRVDRTFVRSSFRIDHEATGRSKRTRRVVSYSRTRAVTNVRLSFVVAPHRNDCVRVVRKTHRNCDIPRVIRERIHL